ncbi:tRNA (adenosine(37)-N6)-dimethylallyltransferase MiaA [candidate division WOR-1 bacterium RIFCSPHIGHO2_02_FULL_45_12]|uniref:tRNA dimethylallyltransferase n=1 Tax=candidate division WOR-1 bacterium RIFCSPLOWO2_12_FULL_45_9 TaxID=1802568 RepID=A0A1F4RLX9_UNCSA|nr:MAG: tRNA (adenosine(37)-N6)-dimethylallyltransferase MiaA [candidate division WOR-1 bacterium RIFCSPHIGHO2_02_FULL_45_12]OGC09180.1 MAG: tRNA (adenosine(37)-N6)-dimethylallyltransferase MiaA [candidate division WOR-1 bacterium RIFCSPLOWO2_12_FULL_45_9]
MIIILGPTAVGKSKLALELAKRINGEIISADSMQVYRGMDIGTAKPTKEEEQSLPHHLINIRNPDEEWTVSDFVEQTNQLEKEIASRKKTPLIVGGTGLYLWSLLEGYSFPVAPVNKELRQRLEKEPLTTLYRQLTKIDPDAANRIHPNDRKRIIRGLEVYELTGKPMSELQKKRDNPSHLSASNPHLILGLNLPRPELYERINQRVGQMIVKGLIEEVKGLLAKGYAKTLPSFQALGYKEVVEYLDGKGNKEDLLVELKKRTRHFARRQLTWFKRFKEVKWLEPTIDITSILDYINNI